MNKYVIISIEEAGPFANFESSLLVKVNPVQVVNYGYRDLGRYTSQECEDTLWLLFRNRPFPNKAAQLNNYARACESGAFLELDIINWFDRIETIINNNGNFHSQIIYISRDHDNCYDEMEYYYQTHGNEAYSKFEEEQYIAQQRRRREAGLMYDDYIDSYDEENEWDY